MTKIVNNLDRNKDRVYEHDALGRLIKAKGGVAAGATGVTANWTQDYSFDRYGNKLTTASSGITANSQAIPTDGLPSLSYTTSTNRISTSGYDYDKTGNLIRGQSPSGVWQRFEYDAAGRLVKIKDDSNNVLETYTYGASRNRLRKESNSQRTYYAWSGSSVLVEYFETASTPTWLKSYIYAGSRLLSTISNISGTEATEYHHPDRLGTKLITNSVSQYEQTTLPFGTSIDAETTGTTNQRFTSYDRSGSTGLDYAVNRTYNTGQSRFTQVDPIGMSATSQYNPQSMNLFAYVQNNPIDFIDPSGLLRVLQCTRYWWTDSGGIHYSPPVGCQTIYDDGGGGGSGGGGGGSGNGQGDGQSQAGISENCKKQISLLGEGIWEKIQQLLKNPPLFDIESLPGLFGPGSSLRFGGLLSSSAADDLGNIYFGNYANIGETVGETFDRNTEGGQGALTFRGRSGISGIYYRGSRTNFSNVHFLLHEIVHLVYPEVLSGTVDLDDELILDLSIKRDTGQASHEAVSRFFNSGCDPKYGGVDVD